METKRLKRLKTLPGSTTEMGKISFMANSFRMITDCNKQPKFFTVQLHSGFVLKFPIGSQFHTHVILFTVGETAPDRQSGQDVFMQLIKEKDFL